MRHLLLATVVFLAGCGATYHCADAPPPGTTACFEFETTASGLLAVGLTLSLGTLCALIDADLEDGMCPAEGRVGGCAGDEQGSYDYVEWSYDGDIDCDSDEVRVDANGEPTSEDLGSCSVDGGSSINVTFQNNAGGPVTVYWVDTACEHLEYHRLDDGASLDQQTFIGHYWVARAGTGDPLGTVLLERRLVAEDDRQTIAID